jgi:hypothetical protein
MDDRFDARVARLEEHLVSGPEPTAEDYLADAEELFEQGRVEEAEFWLGMAKWRRTSDELRQVMDELEQEDDA